MSQTEFVCTKLLGLLEKQTTVRDIAVQLNMDGRKPVWRNAIVSIAEERLFADALEQDLPPDCAFLAKKAWERWRKDIADPATRIIRLRNLVGQVKTLRATLAVLNMSGLQTEKAR